MPPKNPFLKQKRLPVHNSSCGNGRKLSFPRSPCASNQYTEPDSCIGCGGMEMNTQSVPRIWFFSAHRPSSSEAKHKTKT